jgi:hypothetical protein
MGGGSAVTGPEHYREGEQWLADAVEAMAPDADMGYLAWKVSVAQVHATLALAAATAMAAYPKQDDDGLTVKGMHGVDYDAWNDVAGVNGGD